MFLLPDVYWQICQTNEKGRGVFAKQYIFSGTVIGDYLGKVISLADYSLDLEQGMYLMAFGSTSFIYPDMSEPGIYLVNHSCRPNAWIYIYKGHTLFFALRDITPGEEITILYLLSPKDETCDPCIHICKCGGKQCRGTMHLSQKAYRRWRKFIDEEKNTTKMAPYRIGAKLPKLLQYPKKIPNNPIYESIYASS